ncbi:hypothetical protein [Rugosimonospora africana]|uniref:Uncharacterized protein n=1 Tax=Rugosimonospora africana TaxID=556532 RepID=A0A8J3QLY1_9ACTN|nr:hypothetical protein [Rugosimonospora africana]GIH13398.1 hypothetical protein Raf01_15700 [Rugosimonospora africana]
MRKVLLAFGFIVGLYLFGRAVVEPFVINLSDPSTYRHDWGGPSLIGVLAVHCGPGLVFGAAVVTALVRRYGRPPAGSRPDPVSDRPAAR